MYATAVVEGKVVRFKLSPALARAHRQNRGKTMTEGEAVAFVEASNARVHCVVPRRGDPVPNSPRHRREALQNWGAVTRSAAARR
jgi:hypothetical protein